MSFETLSILPLGISMRLEPLFARTVAAFAGVAFFNVERAPLKILGDVERVTWDASNPAAYLCRASSLASIKRPLGGALDGREVAIARSIYIHRWSSMRGQPRLDLLDRISADAKAILEFGCGEAPLGAALKQRQKCRVVGIEIDPKAAAMQAALDTTGDSWRSPVGQVLRNWTGQDPLAAIAWSTSVHRYGRSRSMRSGRPRLATAWARRP